MFYAHAAMTVGARGLAEHVFVWRIVLIDEELIGKVEADAAKRIPLARWLVYPDRPLAVATNSQSHPREHRRILRKGGKIFVVDNGRWYIPRRIERDVLHGLCQQRSCVS